MRIAVGSDHAGCALKEEIVRFLAELEIEFRDFGVFSEARADYPDTGLQVAEAVANGEFDRGVLVCSTGIGMSITANKVPGIRAALCGDMECAVLSREHNDSNVLVLGARVTPAPAALEILRVWLDTPFPGEERHARRIRKIAEIEEKYNGGRC
jgi:ribose 5-phosphate isomerase B